MSNILEMVPGASEERLEERQQPSWWLLTPHILWTLSVWIFCRLRCPLVAMSTYWSSHITLPDMPRLSQPGTNRRKPLPESYLIISSVIMASLPGYTVTRVATLKVKILRSCTPLQTLISQGLILITRWAVECQKGLIKRSSICLELLRMTKSLTGRPTCLLWSMRTIQMNALGNCLIF